MFPICLQVAMTKKVSSYTFPLFRWRRYRCCKSHRQKRERKEEKKKRRKKKGLLRCWHLAKAPFPRRRRSRRQISARYCSRHISSAKFPTPGTEPHPRKYTHCHLHRYLPLRSAVTEEPFLHVRRRRAGVRSLLSRRCIDLLVLFISYTPPPPSSASAEVEELPLCLSSLCGAARRCQFRYGKSTPALPWLWKREQKSRNM